MEVNRTLASEHQLFFRTPKELLSEFSTNLKKVIEFQNYHRTRLSKHRDEQLAKASKFVKGAQAEITKHKEREKEMISERDMYKTKCEEQAKVISNLEQQVAHYKTQASQAKRNQQTPNRAKGQPSMKLTANTNTTTFYSESRPFNLNGSTPLSGISLTGIPTSTPIDQEMNLFGGGVDNDLESSPVVVSGGGNLLNTPALLGINTNQQRRTSTPRGSSFFNI
jgi:hypothetical protein